MINSKTDLYSLFWINFKTQTRYIEELYYYQSIIVCKFETRHGSITYPLIYNGTIGIYKAQSSFLEIYNLTHSSSDKAIRGIYSVIAQSHYMPIAERMSFRNEVLAFLANPYRKVTREKYEYSRPYKQEAW